MTTPSPDSLQPPSPSNQQETIQTEDSGRTQLDFTEAPGSGAAATLAFVHIGIVGVVIFGTYQLLMSLHPNLVLSPILIWQYLLPICMGIALFFPTDPLTRVIALSARVVGVIGLFLAMVAFLLSAIEYGEVSDRSENIPTGFLPSTVVFLAHLSAAWMAAVCIGEAIRCHLLGYQTRPWSEWLGGLCVRTTLPLIIIAISLHLILDAEQGITAPLGGLLSVLLGIPACRLAAYACVRRAFRRPGAETRTYSPFMAAIALAIVFLTQRALCNTPVLSAILVGFGVWSLLPYLSGSKLNTNPQMGSTSSQDP